MLQYICKDKKLYIVLFKNICGANILSKVKKKQNHKKMFNNYKIIYHIRNDKKIL